MNASLDSYLEDDLEGLSLAVSHIRQNAAEIGSTIQQSTNLAEQATASIHSSNNLLHANQQSIERIRKHQGVKCRLILVSWLFLILFLAFWIWK